MPQKKQSKEKSEEKTIASLGEFGLIEHLTSNIKTNRKTTVKGIGDDAAVIKSGRSYGLITTDMLVEGIHFNLIYTPFKHLGYKAVVVNLSDIAAMNGDPEQITVSIAISNKITLESIEDFYEGVKLACKKFNVDLVGGDTTTSITGMTISITAFGRVNKDKIAYRSGASDKELICVSGDLGGAYLGLQLLERELKVFQTDPYTQPDLTKYQYILQRQLKPEPRLDIIEKLKTQEIIPTSMIDISDGLSSELLHICKSSDVGCKVYEEHIPINHACNNICEEFKIDPGIPALNGGEDYELLFTVSTADYEKIKSIEDIHVIGHITHKSEGAYLIARNQTAVPLEAQGWNPIGDKN